MNEPVRLRAVANPPAQPLIALQEATIGYRTPGFFTGVNYSLNAGDFLGIVGPNGAGKTTVLKTLLGTLPLLAGKRNDLLSGRRPRFGYVPQRDESLTVLPLSALEVVLMGTYHNLGLIRWPSKRQRDLSLEALAATGIADLRDRPFRALSGGQKQRTLIARALAAEPTVLLLDEPTNGMDIVSQKAILDLLVRLHEKHGLTVLIISHLLTEVASVVKQLLLVDKDKNLFVHGPTEEVLDKDLLEKIYNCGLHIHREGGRVTIGVESGDAGGGGASHV
jgi:ABC-type Mn2+/Zn2+ transport system ATPase subunit